jgi:hypothetical protein
MRTNYPEAGVSKAGQTLVHPRHTDVQYSGGTKACKVKKRKKNLIWSTCNFLFPATTSIRTGSLVCTDRNFLRTVQGHGNDPVGSVLTFLLPHQHSSHTLHLVKQWPVLLGSNPEPATGRNWVSRGFPLLVTAKARPLYLHTIPDSSHNDSTFNSFQPFVALQLIL